MNNRSYFSTEWRCDNCAYQNSLNTDTCIICGTHKDVNKEEMKSLANSLFEGYLKNIGKKDDISTEINDYVADKELEKSHIQTIILTFGYIREWENLQKSGNYIIPPGITRIIAEYARKVRETKKIGDLLSAFL